MSTSVPAWPYAQPGVRLALSSHHGIDSDPFILNKPRYIICHGTGFQASQTAFDVATDFATTNPNSAHYAIDRAGLVVCIVPECWWAWANGVIQPGADPWWTDDPNGYTISIEHVNDGNNSLALTPAQQAASFTLIAGICRRWGIPARKADALGGITGHFSITPVSRSQCPGPAFPWAALWAYLAGWPNVVPAGWKAA